ncbi:DUF2779 domain-containing protein [uncultured Campylobacter sp.]|uniref:DUF2779 domain-containing protein n=1 Tax=uncultured Campylobacter sp. TaxID=218934 RepID=UPI00262527BD|nr:DUF2779 domain-containing protein [uncultured Campylobacter sp.]
MNNKFLSKSLYVRGLQCPKSLWLKKYKRDVLDQNTDPAVFETGNIVGELACELFGGGKRIKFDGGSFDEKIVQTENFIKNGEKAIYEATFCFDEILVMVDILQVVDGKLIINEVKSSTSLSDVYVDDASIQYYVISSLGYEVERINVIYLNNQYIRGEKLELDKLFTVNDVTDQILSMQSKVAENIKKLKETINDDVEPNLDIGVHCFKPYECDGMNYCWCEQRKIPDGTSVFNIAKINKKKATKLYQSGIVNIADIKDIDAFNANQQIQIKAQINGEEFVDKEAIREFLDTLSYPLYHLDFETFQQAVPEFIGLRPYEQIPFQFSIHKDDGKGNLEHFEFLAEAGADPRYELALNLIKFIPQDACVLAYHASFEKGVIQNLAALFPQFSSHLMSMHSNIKDLEIPFAKKFYYHPKMHGSSSIKKVLPAIVPSFKDAYTNLNLIHNGGEAMGEYAKLKGKTRGEQDAIRKALLAYCKLDTLAMVKVLEKLREVAH